MILSGSGCVFKRCEAIEAGVRPVHIVVAPPFLDVVASVPIAGEEPLVEALIAKPADPG